MRAIQEPVLDNPTKGFCYRVCRSAYIRPGTMLGLSEAQASGRMRCLERLSQSWYRVLKAIEFKQGEILVFDNIPHYLVAADTLIPEEAWNAPDVTPTSSEQVAAQEALDSLSETCLPAGLSLRQAKAWEILSKQGSLRMPELEALCCDVSPRTLHRDLHKMVVRGLLTVTGKNRHAVYRLTERSSSRHTP